jgi:Fibronectin type III-like domain
VAFDWTNGVAGTPPGCLTAGADVSLHVTPRQATYWSVTEHDWVVGAGSRTLYVGSSSRDLPLQATVYVSG